MTVNFKCGTDACFKQSHIWDYSMFDGCFGSSNIRPMDIDGFVERNGKALFIETKGGNVGQIPVGQMRSLEWMARGIGQTVLVMFGNPGNPERAFALYPGGLRRDWNPATVDDMRDFVARWFSWAESQPNEWLNL